MADKTGQSSPELIEELLSRGHEFSFDQVMRLARVALGPDRVADLPEDGGQHRLAVRPDLSLAFPAADVARVERTGEDEGGLLVTATFLGLYGSSSPLPTHYTEDLLDEAASDSSVSRDFLDIIHQRLYQLYCQCWSKYRLFIRVAEEKNPRDRERLFCLIGLGEKELREALPDPWSLVRYAGLLTDTARTSEGLQTLLRDALGIRNLEVEQCVLRQAPIPSDQRATLGISDVHVGVDSVVGSEMADRMGKFRIHIGPLSKADFNLLLPGTPRHEKLVRLVRLYISDPLDFDLRITISAGEIRPLGVGVPNPSGLGLNTWCFSGETIGERTVTFPAASGADPAAQASGSDGTALPSDFLDCAEEREPRSLIEYYQEELADLRELAADYAENHPELASLVLGNPADPSVERLFESIAFLNAHLLQKLDDDWPEIIDDVVSAVEPNALRPIPAATIMVFSPKQNCRRSQVIPIGTEITSAPIDGTACRFTTRWPVEIHPLVLTDTSFSQLAGKPPTIILNMKLKGLRLEEWNLNSLRLFLAGDYDKASTLYLVLTRYLKRIVISPVGEGQSVTLDPSHLKPVGFGDSEELFPSEVRGISGNNVMQEFFILPEKYLFLDLQGWETWRGRGKGTEFEIRFELKKLPLAIQVTKEDFIFFATPAINVFSHKAAPITIDGENVSYAVQPDGNALGSLRAYAVESVTGITRNRNLAIQRLAPHAGNIGSSTQPTYHLTSRPSSLDEDICLTISSSIVPTEEISTITVQLKCSNGKLPERLNIGDIFDNTDSSPVYAHFSNCTRVTQSEFRVQGNGRAWRTFSKHDRNISLLNAKMLRAILKSMAGSRYDGHSAVERRENRIVGIMDAQVTAVDRLIGSTMLRGWEIRIKLNEEHYVSSGDRYLFGAVLDSILNGFSSQSSFTRITIEDRKGERYQWPVKKGRK